MNALKTDIRILGNFLLEDVNSAVKTVVPDEAARAADDVRERKHERVDGEKIRLVFVRRRLLFGFCFIVGEADSRAGG